MGEPTETQRAYIAGLFDGEGSVSVVPYRAERNGERYNRLQVHITNTNRECLEFVRDVVERGWVVRKGRVGRDGRRKPCWRWVIAGEPAAIFLRWIRFYLIVKGARVDEVLAGDYRGRVAVVQG